MVAVYVRVGWGAVERAVEVGAKFYPTGRGGRVEKVSAVVVFACSDAASWITGVDIPVDGGFSVWGPDEGRSPHEWFSA